MNVGEKTWHGHAAGAICEKGSDWKVRQGFCTNGNGNGYYDGWEYLGVTNGWGNGGLGRTWEECMLECASQSGCSVFYYSAGASRC